MPAAIGVAIEVPDLRCSVRCSLPWLRCSGHADLTASPKTLKLSSFLLWLGFYLDFEPQPSVELILMTRPTMFAGKAVLLPSMAPRFEAAASIITPCSWASRTALTTSSSLAEKANDIVIMSTSHPCGELACFIAWRSLEPQYNSIFGLILTSATQRGVLASPLNELKAFAT